VLLTTHPILVPRSWNSRAIPLPTLWATTRPVMGTLYFYLLYLFIYLLWSFSHLCNLLHQMNYTYV
jgi:hypothetical protein